MKRKARPLTDLLIFILVIYGFNYTKKEFDKTQILPGNIIEYRGKPHEIAKLTIDQKNNSKSIALDSLDGKLLPVDSVKNNYRPFWKRLYSN